MARQFNQTPPICEQAEYHMFQREKVEVQLPELFHKIGKTVRPDSVHTVFVEIPHLHCSIHAMLMRVTFPSFGHTGVGAMTWSPLACGIISGKYTNGIPPCSRASLKVTPAAVAQPLEFCW